MSQIYGHEAAKDPGVKHACIVHCVLYDGRTRVCYPRLVLRWQRRTNAGNWEHDDNI